MIYVDRKWKPNKGNNGTGQAAEVYLYAYRDKTSDPSFSQSLGIKAWRNVSEYKTFCSGNPSIC